MPVIAESISLSNNISSAKLMINDSLLQNFKKNDKENVDNHISPTYKQVINAKIDYVQATNNVNASNNNALVPRYIQLKPNQTPIQAPISYAKILQTHDNKSNEKSNGSLSTTSSSSSSSSSPATPKLPKPKRVLFDKANVQFGWTSPQVSNWNSGSGLNNVGNSCYLNSALQAFLHVPALAQWLLSEHSEHRQRCKENCIICCMSNILLQSHRMQNSSFTPSAITSRLSSISKLLTPGRQEDAHEFLRGLIEKMEKTFLSRFRSEPWFKDLDQFSKETTPLNQILGGYLRSTVKCLSCHHESVTFQHFQDLPLDISKVTKLNEALDGYFSNERLEECGYKCESCKKRVSATKQFTIEQLPAVLCIQLKRFTAMGGKNSKSITITDSVNLQKYLTKTNETNQQKSRYKFMSMVTHLGSSPAGGHYTAVGKAPNKSFYEFDDSRVNYLPTDRALKANAYVLFYELDQDHNSNNRSSQHNGHSVIHQNGHNYSKHGYENQTNGHNGSPSTSGSINKPGFSKPILPRIITHNSLKPQQQKQKENDSQQLSKNGVGKPSGSNGCSSSNDNQRVSPLTIKLTNGQKRENSDQQHSSSNGSSSLKKMKIDLPNMPNLNGDEDDVNDNKTSTTSTAVSNGLVTPPTTPSKSLVPYEIEKGEEDEEEKVEGKVKTASGVFYETDLKENIKGPSMQGSTITTKASAEQIKRNDDTVQQLSKLHHNGYGASNVITWNNQASQMSKEVSNDKQFEDRKRHYENEDDIEMDRGRLKKMRIHSKSPPGSSSGNSKLPNPFQTQQNMKNNNNGFDRTSNQYQRPNYNNFNHHHNNNNSHNHHSNGFKKNFNGNYKQNQRYSNNNNNNSNFNNRRHYRGGNHQHYSSNFRRN